MDYVLNLNLTLIPDIFSTEMPYLFLSVTAGSLDHSHDAVCCADHPSYPRCHARWRSARNKVLHRSKVPQTRRSERKFSKSMSIYFKYAGACSVPYGLHVYRKASTLSDMIVYLNMFWTLLASPPLFSCHIISAQEHISPVTIIRHFTVVIIRFLIRQVYMYEWTL